jgi:hypothetical protein
MSYNLETYKRIGVRGWRANEEPCTCSNCNAPLCGPYHFTIMDVWTGYQKVDHGMFCDVECAYKYCEYFFPPGGSDDE